MLRQVSGLLLSPSGGGGRGHKSTFVFWRGTKGEIANEWQVGDVIPGGNARVGGVRDYCS